jgi:hypothetical protein
MSALVAGSDPTNQNFTGLLPKHTKPTLFMAVTEGNGSLCVHGWFSMLRHRVYVRSTRVTKDQRVSVHGLTDWMDDPTYIKVNSELFIVALKMTYSTRSQADMWLLRHSKAASP